MFITTSVPSTSASQSSQNPRKRMTGSAEAQLPHPWIWYVWLDKVTFRTSVSRICCYIRQGGPAEQKDPGHPPDVGGVSDTAQEVLGAVSKCRSQSHRWHLHRGFPCHGGAAGTGTCVPFLLPPQLGMPPHVREDFKVYQTWLQSSDSRYPAQDGAWPLETMESSLLV